MALCYKKLWKLLIDREMKKKDLHRVAGIAPAAIAKISRNESVTAAVLDRIRTSLKCGIPDIIEIVPDSMGYNVPIYVGKAVPQGWRQSRTAGTDTDKGNRSARRHSARRPRDNRVRHKALCFHERAGENVRNNGKQ